MKEVFLKHSLQLITANKEWDEDSLEKIRYGLEGIYLTIVKLVILLALAIILNIERLFLINLVFFNILRFFAFGVHARNSTQCLITSTVMFIIFPMLSTSIDFPLPVQIIIASICVLLFLLYAPADTHKRPQKNRKKRQIRKAFAVTIAIIYVLLIIMLKDLSQIILCSLMTETIMILPITYRILGVPYKNH
ncbi:MAG: accessory gene regulator B family protein [Candidatus Faecenecus gallistercoris]|nr:accessory gene regulator B family protein [Bacillota bacterium]MDD7102013.1 accessory gene regulator B family protein [Bacillota bacterium]MDY4051723.1 accessory gene regulator B family protein [Candidatus Faecenecus gallistercoris]